MDKDLVTGGKYIRFFDERIRHILRFLNEIYQDTFAVKMFSDCICISCPDNLTNLFFMISELSIMQLLLVTDGIFIRGALTRGLHYENENMIFSQGLIRAYELEQKAIYPRIILDDTIVETLKDKSEGYIKDNSDIRYLMHAPDGTNFLDYLDELYSEGLEHRDFLHSHKTSIINQVEENIRDSRIIEKYRWLAEYHNCKFRELFDPEDWDSGYYCELSEELLIPIEKVFPGFSK